MKTYIEPTQEAVVSLLRRDLRGPVVMLNLLSFHSVADYSATPDLAPAIPISGAEAYQLYVDHTFPYLRDSGGDVIFSGSGCSLLIGPEAECWDRVMLVRQQNVESFLAFASHEGYLKGIGHRTAALKDSRLLPLTELMSPLIFKGI
jgi:hypothetical protein